MKIFYSLFAIVLYSIYLQLFYSYSDCFSYSKDWCEKHKFRVQSKSETSTSSTTSNTNTNNSNNSSLNLNEEDDNDKSLNSIEFVNKVTLLKNRSILLFLTIIIFSYNYYYYLFDCLFY